MNESLRSIFFVFLFFLLFVIGSIVASPLLAGIVLCGVFVMVAMIGAPSTALWLFWLSATIMTYVNIHISNNLLVRYGDDVFALILVAQFIAMNYIFARTDVKGMFNDAKMIWWLWRCLLIVFAMSWLINLARPVLAINFFMSYLIFFIIFMHALRIGTEWDVSKVIKFISVFFIINFLVDLTRFAGLHIFPNVFILHEDLAVGLIGDQTVMAYLYCGLIPMALYLFLGSRKHADRVKYLILLVLFVIHFVLTFTVHAYGLLAISVLISFFMARRVVLASSIVAAIVFGFIAVQNIDLPESLRAFEALKLDNLELRYEHFKEGTTVEVYKRVIVDARDDMQVPAIGAGPGMFSSSIGFQRWDNWMAAKYIHDLYLTFSGEMAMRGRSITQSTINGVCAIWGELGWLGFLVFYGLHIYPCFRLGRFLFQKRYKTFEKQALAILFISGMVTYVLVETLRDQLYRDVFLGYWIVLALVWYPDDLDTKKVANET